MAINRITEVSACDNCPENWWYLGTTCCCLLMDKKPCYDDESVLLDNENIPDWCPLPKVLSGSEKTPTKKQSEPLMPTKECKYFTGELAYSCLREDKSGTCDGCQ